MNTKVENFNEARRCLENVKESLAALGQFLVITENTFAAVNRITGRTNEVPSTATVPGNVPASWNERVVEIFKMAGKPIRQKDAVERYRELGWPRSDSKDLYGKISGSFAYLFHKKGRLDRNEDGTYTLKT
jgi:hypothetical protein